MWSMSLNIALAFQNSPGTKPFAAEPVAVVWVHPNAAHCYVGIGDFNRLHAADALRELADSLDASAAEDGLVRTPAASVTDTAPAKGA